MTATAKVVDLLPCPNGHPAKIHQCWHGLDGLYAHGWCYVECTTKECGWHCGGFPTADEAIAHWNKRSSPADARVVITDQMVMVANRALYDTESRTSPNGKDMSEDAWDLHAMRHALEAAERARPLSVDPMQQVIAAVRAYLPPEPDGITKDEFVARIIGIVDPGEPE